MAIAAITTKEKALAIKPRTNDAFIFSALGGDVGSRTKESTLQYKLKPNQQLLSIIEHDSPIFGSLLTELLLVNFFLDK